MGTEVAAMDSGSRIHAGTPGVNSSSGEHMGAKMLATRVRGRSTKIALLPKIRSQRASRTVKELERILTIERSSR